MFVIEKKTPNLI